MTKLTKSCFKIECTWKSRCAIYDIQHADLYFSPPEHSEHCHSFTPKERDNDNGE